MRRNSEGLTWAEWCHAAGYPTPPGAHSGTGAILRAEWLSAVDPSEWRALTPEQRDAAIFRAINNADRR